MSIPDYQTIMLPFLKFTGDAAEHSLGDVIDALVTEFRLSDEARREMLPSGRQEIFANRVGWARTYLKKAGLVTTTRRGYFKITERGKQILANPPKQIDRRFLDQYEEFRSFKT
jgi:restriction system protein